MIRFAAAATAVVLALTVAAQERPVIEPPATEGPIVLGDRTIRIPDTAGAVITPGDRAALMQAKLKAASRALEGTVNGDFGKVGQAAELMRRIAEVDPERYTSVEKMVRTRHFRDEFIRQSMRLRELASERNIEGTAFMLQNVQTTCIECHLAVRTRSGSSP